MTQNLPLDDATVIFSLSSELKPRNTTLSDLFYQAWLIISSFVLCFICVYCIFSYILYLCILSISVTLVSITVLYIVQSSQLAARVTINDLLSSVTVYVTVNSLSVCMSVCLSVYLSACLSVCLSVCRCVCVA